MTEAEEFRISSDIKQANLEIVQARLEQAYSLLKDISETLRSDRKIESANFIDSFLASQQPEGFTHFHEFLESVQQMDAMLKAEGSQGELLPCPFCGGQAHLTYDDYVHDDLRPMPVVECNACHTWVRAESWNKRAALAQPSPRKSQVAEALRVADWSNTCIGNKALILAAIEQLEAQPSPAPELVHCECGDAFPVNSYGAGFMDANNGVCQNCDPATVAQAGQVPKHKFDGLVEEVQLKDSIIAQLRERVANLQAYRDGDSDGGTGVWAWAGDGEDHLESLACPIVISANDLRAVIAQTGQVPDWPPCSKACMPEFGGLRDRQCDCEQARRALAVQVLEWVEITAQQPEVGQCIVMAGPNGEPGRYWRLTGIRREDGYYDANGCTCDDITHWYPLLDSPGMPQPVVKGGAE